MTWSGDAPSFLIVSLRYIGDVLVSTPLALSIRTHIPRAPVDYLVFEGTEGILSKNPLVRSVHAIPPGSRSLRRYAALRKKYDFAIAANPSDRSAFLCAGAGRRSLGFSYFARKEWWKPRLLDVCRLYDAGRHVVPLVLSLLGPLGIPPRPRLTMHCDDDDLRAARSVTGEDPYVLLHPYAGRPYKYWPARSWGALAGIVRERLGVRAVVTASPAPADGAVLEEIAGCSPAGTAFFPRALSLNGLAAAIRGSVAFVGTDTVATHMAAALDVPTIALYGPTMTRHWGPWPNDWPGESPYDSRGGIQRRGSVTVVQKDWQCVPCHRETCALSGGGRILCLEELTAGEVFDELALAISGKAR